MKGRLIAEMSDPLSAFGGAAFRGHAGNFTLSLAFAHFLRYVPPQRLLEKSVRRHRVQAVVCRQLSLLGENSQRLIGQEGQQAGSFIVGESAFEIIAQEASAIEVPCLRMGQIGAKQAQGVIRVPVRQGDAGRIQQRLRLAAPRFLQHRIHCVAVGRSFQVESIFKHADRVVPVLLAEMNASRGDLLFYLPIGAGDALSLLTPSQPGAFRCDRERGENQRHNNEARTHGVSSPNRLRTNPQRSAKNAFAVAAGWWGESLQRRTCTTGAVDTFSLRIFSNTSL